MKILGFGDIHMNLAGVENIPGIRSADCIIVTGDITNFGGRKDAAAVLDRLQSINANILGVAGNLDQPDVADYLEEKGISLHGTGIVLDGLGIVGLGGSNYTPFKTPYEFSEQELASFLVSGFDRLGDVQDFILVSHTPPVQTSADRLLNGNHVGSRAVRSFIEERQPLLCLTGHIHESRGEDHIGRTLVLNPGMLKDGGYIEVHYHNGDISAALRLS